MRHGRWLRDTQLCAFHLCTRRRLAALSRPAWQQTSTCTKMNPKATTSQMPVVSQLTKSLKRPAMHLTSPPVSSSSTQGEGEVRLGGGKKVGKGDKRKEGARKTVLGYPLSGLTTQDANHCVQPTHPPTLPPPSHLKD